MSYNITDKTLITEIGKNIAEIVEAKKSEKNYKDLVFSHPLDDDIIGKNGELKKLLSGDATEVDYSKAEDLDLLWQKLVRKSIECLRFFDKREPFLDLQEKNPGSKPVAYGLDSLASYQDRYTKFESMLYGASAFYRDHVFHAVRTWMLGIFCLIKKLDSKEDTTALIDTVMLDGEGSTSFSDDINFFEKVSMWTIIALCHDLGYPLEKAEQILGKTQEMMKAFVPRPNIWNNFGFNGTQDTINEYIIKFISTKMKATTDHENVPGGERLYLGRIQPKYYLKFAKSLEGFNHGIVSSVIVYKMLLYFLESDFNLNDDYKFGREDARQFYIRREILRAMASHTCDDVYNIYLTTFSSLLFLCDEMQEWGRKSWNDMYAGLATNAINLKINKLTSSIIDIEEEIDMKNVDSESLVIDNIQRVFERQHSHYRTKFRDGQYTKDRDLCIKKKMVLQLGEDGAAENKIEIVFLLSKGQSKFEVNLENSITYSSKNNSRKIKDAMRNSLYEADVSIVGTK